MRTSDELKSLEWKKAQLRKLIKYSAFTLHPLHADINYVVEHWQQDRTSQFWSRIVIRCLCAGIEATLFSFRKWRKK
jgi:hypothetical protein